MCSFKFIVVACKWEWHTGKIVLMVILPFEYFFGEFREPFVFEEDLVLCSAIRLFPYY